MIKIRLRPWYLYEGNYSDTSEITPLYWNGPLIVCFHVLCHFGEIWPQLDKALGWYDHFVQDCSSSCALAMELLQSCIKPLMFNFHWSQENTGLAGFTRLVSSLIGPWKNTLMKCYTKFNYLFTYIYELPSSTVQNFVHFIQESMSYCSGQWQRQCNGMWNALPVILMRRGLDGGAHEAIAAVLPNDSYHVWCSLLIMFGYIISS